MLLQQLKPYSDLITVCGALILFVSWITSNTFVERYNSAKSAYRSSASVYQTFSAIKEIQQSIDSLAALILQTRASADALRYQFGQLEGNSLKHDERNMRIADFDLMKLNARQIDWGARGCNLMLDAPIDDDTRTSSVRQLAEGCRAIDALRDDKNRVMAATQEIVVQQAAVLSEELKVKQRQLEIEYRESILPKFGPLLGQVVEAWNERQAELREAQRTAAQNAAWAKRAALILYVVGTIATISGSALGKLVAVP